MAGLAGRCNGGLAAIALAAWMPGSAAAPSPESPIELGERLEEITVTARRRQERLHDVPVALTVLPQQELVRRQLVDLEGLQFAAPSLVITTDQTNRSTSLIAMRGQFEPGSVPTLDPTVGVYLDGVYIARITGANLRLIDVERVEILRGPQGTLFGRNTIGGALNLVTHRPAPDPDGQVTATLGNYDRRELEGVLNLPFREGRQALRLAGAHLEHSGFGRSTVRGRDLDDDTTRFGRAQLLLSPADGWDLVLSADYTRFRNGGQLRTLLSTSPSAARVTIASGNPGDDIRNYVDPLRRHVPANRAGSVQSTVSGAGITLTREGPAWTFKSITAGRRVRSLALESDQDGTPYDLAAVLRRQDEQEQFSQELQVYGASPGGRLDWIGGLIYFVEEASFDQRFLAFDPATSGWNENLPAGDTRNDSIAAYAQLALALSPRWRVTGGLRANEDGRQLTARSARVVSGIHLCTVDPALRDAPGLCRATLPERRFSYHPYTIGLDFRPAPRTLLYAKRSRGHRAGGYNLRGATEPRLGTFDPEHVTAHEIGARADLFDDRLRLELAAYQSRFRDIQLVQVEFVGNPAQPQLFVQNGGEARIDGAELELSALLGRLRLGGAIGVVDARFTRLNPNVIDVELDSKFLHTPELTVALAADWQLPTALGAADLHLDYSWRDEVYFAYDRITDARQGAYGLWNARVTFDVPRSPIEISLWVRNLADKRYLTRALESATFVSASLGDPRTFGLSLHYRPGAGPAYRARP